MTSAFAADFRYPSVSDAFAAEALRANYPNNGSLSLAWVDVNGDDDVTLTASVPVPLAAGTATAR